MKRGSFALARRSEAIEWAPAAQQFLEMMPFAEAIGIEKLEAGPDLVRGDAATRTESSPS